nr:BRO family protein [Clostridioides difficile]
MRISVILTSENLNNAGENFLTESGVYKLIFKSRKEEAERFQDWISDEVLPSIRQTGAYITKMLIPKTREKASEIENYN